MNAAAADRKLRLVVRQGPLAPEEGPLLDAVVRRLASDGSRCVVVLLGTASYDADPGGSTGPRPPPPVVAERWVLEDEARGRGLRPDPTGGTEVVSVDRFVEALMAAERVVQFP